MAHLCRPLLSILFALTLACVTIPTAAAPIPLSQLTLGTPHSVGPKLAPYEAWPNAVTAANGWVIMIHGSGDRHVPLVDRKLVVRVSKDKGATWKISKVIDTGNMTGLGGIVRLSSGRIVMMVSDLNGHDDQNWTQAWKSDDHGITWSALSKRYAWTDPWSWGNIVPLTCDGGKLMTMWNSDTAWGSATSRDGGATWTRTTHTAQHHLWEGRLVQVSGDRLLVIGRSRELGPILYKSPDCGKTWTSALIGIAPWLTEGAVRHGDLWRMITINRYTFKMEARDASLNALWDNPKAWSAPKLLRQLKPAGVVDIGYPAVLNVSRSFDLVLWYGPTSTPKQPMIYAATLPWQAS